MALIICPECGKEISEKAHQCPFCGCPDTEWTQSEIPSVSESANGEQGVEQNHDNTGYSNSNKYTVEPANSFNRLGLTIKLIAAAVGFFVILCILGGIMSNNSKEYKEDAVTSIESKETKDELSTESRKEIVEAKEKFEKGKYHFITLEDLDKYYPNLKGKKVYVVAQAEEIMEDEIHISLGSGFMFTSLYTDINYKDIVSEGDLIAVFGKVDEAENYVIAESKQLKGCQVFAIGDDANAYKKEKSSKKLKKYLTVTAEVADKSGSTEEEYKALCEELSYKDVLRNPDEYDGKYAVVSGKVDQIIEGLFDTYTIYIKDSNGNKWECSYLYKEDESHMLEGDSVKVYGKCKGTSTSTTLLGKQVTLVYIDAEYFE